VGLAWSSPCGGLTVKLRGRAEAPDWRRGRTLSPGARGAKPLAHHGPLQRLLGVAKVIIACGHGAPAQTTQRVAIPLSYVACSKLAGGGWLSRLSDEL